MLITIVTNHLMLVCSLNEPKEVSEMRFKPGDKVIRRETWEVKQERLGRYDITMPSAFPPVSQSMLVEAEEIIDADALNYEQYKRERDIMKAALIEIAEAWSKDDCSFAECLQETAQDTLKKLGIPFGN